MLTGTRRLRALWRAFRAADAPLPRRAWGLCVALLPSALRARVLRFSGRRFRVPSWLTRVLVNVGGYLVIATGALLALWLWGRIGAALCASHPERPCVPLRSQPPPELSLSGRVTGYTKT